MARSWQLNGPVGFPADLRYSARSFTRAPGLAIALLFSVALGIGSNAVVHGFVRGLAGRPLPAPGIDAVVSVFEHELHASPAPLSYERYRALNDLALFDWVGAARESQRSMDLGGAPSAAAVAEVTGDVARLLQLPRGDGAVISHRLWIERFATGRDRAGQRMSSGLPGTLRVDGVEMRIAGVAPEWLDSLYSGRLVDVWLPLTDVAPEENVGAGRALWVLARLRRGVSIGHARATLATGGGVSRLAVLPYTGINPEMSLGLLRIGELLRTAAAAVFVIACVNVALFLLARASARSRETSVRAALGAGRAQLARQLLADSAVISLAGGALGLLAAAWTTLLIPALFFERDAGQLVFAPDVPGIAFVSGASLALTMACGLVPLFELRHDRPAAILQRESAGASAAMRRVRAVLVVCQLACCYLLVVTTLMTRQGMADAVRTSLGDRLGQPILATVHAAAAGAARDEVRTAGLRYFQDVERTARGVTNAVATAWTDRLPGSRPAWQGGRVQPVALPTVGIEMDAARFSADMLRRVELPPAAGRLFGGGDGPSSCPVVVVNQAAADHVFGGDAVGVEIQDVTGRRFEIVGVVKPREDAKAAKRKPTVYYYAQQADVPFGREGAVRFLVPERRVAQRVMLDAHIVSSGYFRAMELQPSAGELFGDAAGANRCRVAVVSQEAEAQYFGGRAVGAAVVDDRGSRTTIVGVVPSASLRVAARRPDPAIYFPMGQDFAPRMTLLVGARHPAVETLLSLRRALASVQGGSDVPLVTTLDAHLRQTALAPERIATMLVACAAATALSLGILGVYLVVAESVRHQQREIALRIALGAPRRRVLGLVFGESLRLTTAGAMVGLIGAVVVTRWLARITLGGGSVNGRILVAALIVLSSAVAAASLLPALRALRVDPLSIMRE